MQKIVIAISGAHNIGKDFVGEALKVKLSKTIKRDRIEQQRFANPIKDLIKSLLGIYHIDLEDLKRKPKLQVTIESPYSKKSINMRDLHILLGEHIRHNTDEEIFTKTLINNIKYSNSPIHIITDLRTSEEEFALLEAFGEQLFHLHVVEPRSVSYFENEFNHITYTLVNDKFSNDIFTKIKTISTTILERMCNVA